MSQNRVLFQAIPSSNRFTALATPLSAVFASITAFFASSAHARQQARNAAYLSEATDLYDLEARVRELDKQSAIA